MSGKTNAVEDSSEKLVGEGFEKAGTETAKSQVAYIFEKERKALVSALSDAQPLGAFSDAFFGLFDFNPDCGKERLISEVFNRNSNSLFYRAALKNYNDAIKVMDRLFDYCEKSKNNDLKDKIAGHLVTEIDAIKEENKYAAGFIAQAVRRRGYEVRPVGISSSAGLLVKYSM